MKEAPNRRKKWTPSAGETNGLRSAQQSHPALLNRGRFAQYRATVAEWRKP